MTEKRFIFHKNNDDVEDTLTGEFYDVDRYRFDIGIVNKLNELAEENEQLKKENKELKFQNGELLYQIGEVGKNNKTCQECECFISNIHYCWMWDMEVKADDVVVACDQRKIKKTKEMILND